MAPKILLKKKTQKKKSGKFISKPIEMDHEENYSNYDSDGSLDAIEFNSEYYKMSYKF